MPRYDNKLGVFKIVVSSEEPDYFIYKNQRFLLSEFDTREFNTEYKYILSVGYSMFYALNIINDYTEVELRFLIY